MEKKKNTKKKKTKHKEKNITQINTTMANKIVVSPKNKDFNPIETAWAQLRKEGAVREFENLRHDKIITVQQSCLHVDEIYIYSPPFYLICKCLYTFSLFMNELKSAQ